MYLHGCEYEAYERSWSKLQGQLEPLLPIFPNFVAVSPLPVAYQLERFCSLVVANTNSACRLLHMHRNKIPLMEA